MNTAAFACRVYLARNFECFGGFLEVRGNNIHAVKLHAYFTPNQAASPRPKSA
jgi:hypothetical protein